MVLHYISETPPPAYSPPEDSQQGQSAALADPSAMDTTSNIMPEVAPVSYQVNVILFCLTAYQRLDDHTISYVTCQRLLNSVLHFNVWERADKKVDVLATKLGASITHKFISWLHCL